MSERGPGGGGDGSDRPGEQPVGRGEDPVDVDAAWAEIVARWEEPPGSRPAREEGPTTEGTTTEGTGQGREGTGAPRPAQGPRGGPPVARAGEGGTDADPVVGAGPDAATTGPVGEDAPRPAPRGWRDEDVPTAGDGRPAAPGGAVPPREEDEDDDHFVPPPPQPSPPVGPLVRAAWVGALGGPALLLVCALVWRDAPTLVVVVAVVAFVAGFAVLVSRLPRSHDDGDDGAVV